MDLSENAEKTAELTQLEEVLAKKEYELWALYCQMGKHILEIATAEQKNVDSLVDEIIEQRKKIGVVKHVVVCSKCMTHNTADSSYCRRCGALLTTEP